MNSGEQTKRPGNEHGLKAFRQITARHVVVVVVLAVTALFLLPAAPGHVQTTDAGYALLFDGNNDFVELHETNQVMDAGWEELKTVSLWVKPTNSESCFMGDPAHCELVFGDKPRWWGISIGERHGEDKIWIWNFDGNYDVVGVNYSFGTWVHVTLVHADGMLRAYRNGVEVGSTPSGATQQSLDDPILHLGGMISTESRILTFAGELDEVRLWNYARTPTQVQTDMYHSLNGDEAGLMAYYMMSDGSGLTLTDDSGNGWNGTLHDGGAGAPPDGSPPEWVSSDAFEVQPTATPTPTSTSTSTPTPTPTSTSTPTPTSTATSASTPTPTSTPTLMPGPTSTSTATRVGDNLNNHLHLPIIKDGG